MVSVEVELVGGPVDGRLVEVAEDMLYRPLMVPVVPSVRDFVNDYTRGAPTISPRPLVYEWDGTVREDGVRRFRLAGMPHPVWD